MYRIGVDVGGTNSDAAILDVTAFNNPNRGVLSSFKAATTPDITSGIEKAIQNVLAESKVCKQSVLSVTIGTTHFINALVEADARRLFRVAVVRLCGPFTRQIPPFSDFTVGLRRVLDGGAYYLDGGLEIDGRQIAPLDHDQIRKTTAAIVTSGVRSVALVGVFSPLDHSGIHEEACKKIILETAPDLDVVCSRNLGTTGIVERENATILNAAILSTARKTIRGFKRAMARLDLSCPLYLSQNDGTLLEADTAVDYPIKTFASGPTNSMTGAAFLAGLDKPKAVSDTGEEHVNGGGEESQVLIIDIGGTTTDVCALLPSGFPRQAPGFVEVGGIRTVFFMPEVASIGLGGGSKVEFGAAASDLTIGPGSVGHFLTTEALVFGGPTLTMTDIAVASGDAELGDRNFTTTVPREVVELASKKTKKMIETVIERMRVSAAPVHVLLVGGGSLLVSSSLEGVAKVTKPVHHDAANAVGAAIAKVSGDVDVIEILEGADEKAVVTSACQKAASEAIRKGADPQDVKIVEVNKIPLQYSTNRAIRLQVRAVGRLSIPEGNTYQKNSNEIEFCDDYDKEEELEGKKIALHDALDPTTKPSLNVDLEQYRPSVKDQVWYVSEVDLELIATGAGVLGTGGGGPTHYELLKALQTLRSGGAGKMRVVSPLTVKDSDLICFGSWYGAPSVINERISGGHEISKGINTLLKLQGYQTFDALFLDEIGGGNGLSAFPTGVEYNVPVIDGDAMGRAYPTMYHATLYINGHPITPAAITDARGNASIVMNAESPTRVESMLRTTAIELGLGCAVCACPLRGSAIREHGVPHTISQAWYIGRAVHMSRKKKTNYVHAIFAVNPGKLLFSGKVVDVRRDVSGGYTMGSVLLAPVKDESFPQSPTWDKHMVIPFQNEYLYAAYTDSTGGSDSEEVVCTVPDLISILGQDGEAIGSQDLRYGLVVSVIAMPSHPLWKTEQGLKVGGPSGFGLAIPFTGIGEYTEPRSVVKDFGEDNVV
ncbi:uncharacterized protein K452DRAFT_234708 [Aplosporella prunicola CBS 121167]|uniref:Hydantoinase/oxoprolinase N-terminal domain-containing protein n=1 Tax=Aplosporella prunicola CBS 121167 TaxID=1176127 RepID=A0A6A6B289_9PEZI|nr:uncharacterized protein K452DRAFT_234708 [Aplosporella prunicola CBS 121167]KAF2138170.1 hypothetical protein K452DRAFT_234708 [Aplosporella prunicola CBS 121167]